MTSIEIHAARIRALLAPLADRDAPESLALDPGSVAADPAAHDRRVLARAVSAPLDLPRFDNSQMDGYAVRSADLAAASADSPVALRVAPPVPAGDPAHRHEAGSATPVMTGSPLPAGADAVVPIERADPPRFPEPGAEAEVSFRTPVVGGAFVRAVGSDARRGEVALEAGTVLRAAHLGLAASLGLTEVRVLPRVRVLVVPTGHEIRPPGASLDAAQIYDANGALLAAAVREAGGVARVVPCTSDRADDLLAVLREHAPSSDLVVTVGGVSAGAYEVVRDALEPLGSTFGHVSMQPGGPQGLGLVRLDPGAAPVPVVSLPGNPVSALVSFEVFLRPALRSLAGWTPSARPLLRVPLGEALESPRGLHQLRRGLLGEDGTVRPVGGPSSHLLASYARSNALIHVPVGVDRLALGDTVEIWRIDD